MMVVAVEGLGGGGFAVTEPSVIFLNFNSDRIKALCYHFVKIYNLSKQLSFF